MFFFIKKHIFKLLIGCLFLFSIITSTFSKTDVVLGFVGDFSEISSEYCTDAFRSAEMFIEEFNSQQNDLNFNLRLEKRDGGNNPERHYQHIYELVKKKKAVAIFGGAASPCVVRASQAALELKIPYLVSIGNSQVIVVEQGHPYVFLFEPNSWMESRAQSILATLFPWKRYAWIGPNYFWGQSLLDAFKNHFNKIGAEIEIVAEEWHQLGESDFNLIIDNVLKAKPDAIHIGTWGQDLIHFFEKAKKVELFKKIPVFGRFSMSTSMRLGKRLPEGVWGISRGPFNYLIEKYPQTIKYVDKYYQKNLKYPNGFSICCYDSFLAWKKAVIQSKSVQPGIIAKQLKGLKFSGLRGDSYIRDFDGQMNCPTYIGRMIYIPQYPFAIMEPVYEIKAEQTWFTKHEVMFLRKKAKK